MTIYRSHFNKFKNISGSSLNDKRQTYLVTVHSEYNGMWCSTNLVGYWKSQDVTFTFDFIFFSWPVRGLNIGNKKNTQDYCYNNAILNTNNTSCG